MPTSGERKALWFFALVALSGTGVRLWRSGSPPPTSAQSAALDRQLQRVDSARESRVRRERRLKATKAERPEAKPPIDLDRATAVEIETLPGIGPALAERIIANRDSAGFFGWIDALCDVRGVGPALAARLRPLVTFSGPRRPLSVACSDGSKTPRKGRGAGHR